MSGFYETDGTLGAKARSYVERRADQELLTALLHGEFCYVLTSRQMGKSSLMVRTLEKLRQAGVRVIALDLTAIGLNLTADQWYDGMLVKIGQQAGLEKELEEHWKSLERLGPVQRFFSVLRQWVAREPGAIVIFVDEIDMVRSLPFVTDEFFAAIRECCNRRAAEEDLKRLNFCLLGSRRLPI